MTAYKRGAGKGSRSGRLDKQRTNVLLIDTDDEAWCEAMPQCNRPVIEVLKHGGTITTVGGTVTRGPGVELTAARCVEGLCQGSRTLEATGQYQQNNGVIGNLNDLSALNTNHLIWKMLWGLSNDRLVQTAIMGKTLGPGAEPGLDQLFKEFTGLDEQYSISAASPNNAPASKYDWQVTERRYDADGTKNYEAIFPTPTGSFTRDASFPYSVDYLTDRLVNTIRRMLTRTNGDPRKGLPFFIVAYPGAPHDPYDLPPTTNTYARNRTGRYTYYDTWIPPQYDTAGGTAFANINQSDPKINAPAYNGTAVTKARNRQKVLCSVDDLVAAACAELAAQGALDDTLIIYKSDNGFYFGEHDDWDGKGTFEEPAIRIPWIFNGPGFNSGGTLTAPVFNIDLFPTICRALNIYPDWVTDNGYAIQDIMSGAVNVDNRVIPTCNGKEIISDPLQFGIMVGGRYKLHYTSNRLYDLLTDPWELTDQQANPAYATILSDLQALRTSQKTCSGPTCFVTYP